MPVPKSVRTLERGHDKRLFAYALAAGAGMMAAGTPAEAGVIYVNPPDLTYINVGFQVDLNGDDGNDIAFTALAGSWFGAYFWRSLLAAANGMVGNGSGIHALRAGTPIGPGAPFVANGWMAWIYVSYDWRSVWGPWVNVRDHYLGVRFQIGPNTHYGWVRMDVLVDAELMTIAATVKDWAYDNTPGAGISAGDTGVIPEPGTLSLLALGSAGLALWRRRKAQSRAA